MMAQKRIGPWNWWALLASTQYIQLFLMRQFSAVASTLKMIMMAFGWNLWLNTTQCLSADERNSSLEYWMLQEEPDSNRHLTSQTENLCCFVFQLGASSVCLLIANGVLYVKIYPNHRISRKILLQAWKWRSKWILNAINYQNSLHHINTLLCGTSHEIFWWIHIVWNLRIFTDNWDVLECRKSAFEASQCNEESFKRMYVKA